MGSDDCRLYSVGMRNSAISLVIQDVVQHRKWIRQVQTWCMVHHWSQSMLLRSIQDMICWERSVRTIFDLSAIVRHLVTATNVWYIAFTTSMHITTFLIESTMKSRILFKQSIFASITPIIYDIQLILRVLLSSQSIAGLPTAWNVIFLPWRFSIIPRPSTSIKNHHHKHQTHLLH